MIYIIFTMSIIINIFNILLIANNKIYQNIKEKTLLVTYSIAELIYLIFILSLIEYTAANTVFVISFISIWLLSKAYISVINIKFDEIGFEEEKYNDFGENIDELESNLEFSENPIETPSITDIENIEENVNIQAHQEENIDIQVQQEEKIEEFQLSDVVDNNFNDIYENTSQSELFNEFSGIVSDAKIDDEPKMKNNRRSLALKISRISAKDNRC